VRPWNDHPPGPGLCYPARVEPREIAYVCQLTEAHEGLAVVRTIDQALGLIEFWVSPSMRETFESFAAALGEDVGLRVAAPRKPMLE
jgi:hypothetical protein